MLHFGDLDYQRELGRRQRSPRRTCLLSEGKECCILEGWRNDTSGMRIGCHWQSHGRSSHDHHGDDGLALDRRNNVFAYVLVILGESLRGAWEIR